MKAHVRYERLTQYKRVIALSDIHGDFDGFRGLLQALRFSPEDALVIVGDIVEKGPNSLKLLRYVMELQKQGNVYVTMGNNDVLFEEWFVENVPDEHVFRYISAVPNTTIREMAVELDLPLETCEDLSRLKAVIPEAFPEELSFLLGLPDILETELATFVHAGLKPGPISELEREFCLTAPAFDHQTNVFPKPVVVGHWPCSNYCGKIINACAKFNEKTNVYSLDGGNSMKSWQQINYLMIKNGTFTTGYYDMLPKIRALEDQMETQDPVTVIFPDTNLQILETEGDICRCYFPSIDMTRDIRQETIYEYKKKLYCPDFTTYHLSIRAGEILSLCSQGEQDVLIKREGIVGHYKGKFEFT